MAKDKFGNEHGTTYSESGVATPAGKNLPQNAEKPILYNENGSVFTLPADHEKTILTMKADITSLNIAVSKGEEKIRVSKEMLNEAEADEKPLFEKAIKSQQIALDSNKAAKAAKEEELKNFRLSLITPAQRADLRQLGSLEAQKITLDQRIKDLRDKMKIYSVAEEPKGAVPKANGVAGQTEEQKAIHAAMIAEHGSQGKAIVFLVKEGKKNNEIAALLGIPQASIPGPKNAFLNSTEGAGWKVNDEGRTVRA